jgi:uncharacterized membrane protein AbrB (regulator of aidB expression)
VAKPGWRWRPEGPRSERKRGAEFGGTYWWKAPWIRGACALAGAWRKRILALLKPLGQPDGARGATEGVSGCLTGLTIRRQRGRELMPAMKRAPYGVR